MTVAGVRSALSDAALDPTEDGLALVLGTSYGAHLDEEVSSLYQWATRAAGSIGFQGVPVCVSTACSAASDAVAVAAELVDSGACRVAVCGGVDILTPAKRLAHSKLGTLSPERLRAFDTKHSGMLLGEGAAFLVLERGAERTGKSHGVLRGVGSSNDAVGVTAPAEDGKSVRMAIERALFAAELDVGDIGAVSAHGTGTALNDAAEIRGLTQIFGENRNVPVIFGTKGALGHSLGACGAIEAITLLMALRDRVAPPTVGLREPMPEAAPFLRPGRREIHGSAGISLTLGFGGFNTAIVFSVEGGSA